MVDIQKSRPVGQPGSAGGSACPHCGQPMPGRANPDRQERKKLSTGCLVALVIGGIGLVSIPVIGILAAIAIPNFVAMQLRAKRSEAPTNADAIRVAELAYFAAFDSFVELPTCPESLPEREQVPFSGSCAQAWDQFGWTPTGPVRCQYTVVLSPGNELGEEDFEVTAECDVDGDGQSAVYQASRHQKAMMVTPNSQY